MGIRRPGGRMHRIRPRSGRHASDGVGQDSAHGVKIRARGRLPSRLLWRSVAGYSARRTMLDMPIWMYEQRWRQTDQRHLTAGAQNDVRRTEIAVNAHRPLALEAGQHLQDLQCEMDRRRLLQAAASALNAV